MTNVKVQITNEIQSSNIKEEQGRMMRNNLFLKILSNIPLFSYFHLDFEIWHSFEIWILTFEIDSLDKVPHRPDFHT